MRRACLRGQSYGKRTRVRRGCDDTHSERWPYIDGAGRGSCSECIDCTSRHIRESQENKPLVEQKSMPPVHRVGSIISSAASSKSITKRHLRAGCENAKSWIVPFAHACIHGVCERKYPALQCIHSNEKCQGRRHKTPKACSCGRVYGNRRRRIFPPKQ